MNNSSSQYVKLNVGGNLFYTAVSTLTKYDNMLKAMFSGRMDVPTDTEGWVLIDRCGKHFGLVLNFLRDGEVPLPENARELAEIYAEAKYYCIQELGDACDAAMKKLSETDVQPICRIPLITNAREEQLLVSESKKPVVKLLINRHNNKYSYTCASDDNMLKNLELFDKLCLRFSHRILFIKNVTAATEICMWTYYGCGQKAAEVCCTSIVYATDKKHTKVECPEARIYEETLNIMLYENRDFPDADIMQATARRIGVPVGTSDDEEALAAAGASGSQGRVKSGLERLRSNKLMGNGPISPGAAGAAGSGGVGGGSSSAGGVGGAAAGS